MLEFLGCVIDITEDINNSNIKNLRNFDRKSPKSLKDRVLSYIDPTLKEKYLQLISTQSI